MKYPGTKGRTGDKKSKATLATRSEQNADLVEPESSEKKIAIAACHDQECFCPECGIERQGMLIVSTRVAAKVWTKI